MKILLSYSKAHFDPDKQPAQQKYWGSSANILARALYRTLTKLGSVTYIDGSEYQSVAGLHFDLFIGVAHNFQDILAVCTAKRSILFAVNMHPKERNRTLRSFLRNNALSRDRLAGWDLQDLKRYAAAIHLADIILCVGNTAVYETYVANGVSRRKIKMLNYGFLPEDIKVQFDSPKARQGNRYLYVASEIGLRKGFDIVADIFGDSSLADQDFHLDIVGSANLPVYKQQLEALCLSLGKKATYHGWVDSASLAYRKILAASDFLVFPSLEEGQAGTVIECLREGVIPILTAASGIDFSPMGELESRIGSSENRRVLMSALQLSASERRRFQAKTKEYYEEFHGNWLLQLEEAITSTLTTDTPYPQVSLVLSVFNKEKTIVPLVRLLDKACRAYGNCELHIIFDGCTDRSERLVRRFYTKDRGYKVSFKVTPNVFEVKSNNIGLRASNGKYCVIIQDDNYVYDANFLFEAVNFLDKDPTTVILGGLAGVNYYPLDTKQLVGAGQIAMTPEEVYWRQDATTNPDLKQRIFQVDACMRGPLFLRKSFLDDHGYLDEAYAPLYQDDIDIAFRAKSLGFKVYCMLMDVANQSLTMSGYDSNKWNYFHEIMKRNAALFYTRWHPSVDKDYLWIWRNRRNSESKAPRISPVVDTLNHIGRALGQQFVRVRKLLRVFDVAYCEARSHDLWKRRMTWVRNQASLVPAGSTVLDVGAGQCLYRDSFDHCKYITQDFEQTPNFAYGTIDIVSDICKIPLADASVDVVLCSEVFEHIPYPIDALREITRLLRPGGRLIFSAPLGSGQHQVPYHFYGGYTRFWYEKFFPECGLRIDSLNPNGGLFGHLVELLWRSQQYVVPPFRSKGGLARFASMLLQLLVYNIPTVVLSELERGQVIEDFTVCFLCTATKGTELV